MVVDQGKTAMAVWGTHPGLIVDHLKRVAPFWAHLAAKNNQTPCSVADQGKMVMAVWAPLPWVAAG